MAPSVWGIHDTAAGSATMPSGCGFYRIILPLDELARHGWKTGYGVRPPMDIRDESQILIGERFDQPYVAPYWEALRDDYRLVYEIDDNPWVLDPVNWLARSVYDQEETLGTIARCAAAAHLVTVTCEPLAEHMRQFNPDVRVIPNFIPASLLETQRPRHEKLTVGWTGGISHGRDMTVIAQTWRDVIDETGVRGHFLGSDYRNMLRHQGFDYTPWQIKPRAYLEMIDFDIGLAPLSGHEFNRHKSPIKAIEYGALGIPVIASDTLPYSEYVIDGVTGFLCKTQAQWREAMLALIGDPALRESMGTKAREQAAGWTIEGNWQLWADAYSSLLEGGHG